MGSITITPLKDNVKIVYLDITEAHYDFPCKITDLSYNGNAQIGTDWSYESWVMGVPIDENGYGYADIVYPCGMKFNNGVNDSRFPKTRYLEFSGVQNHSQYLAVPADLKWELAERVEGLP